MWANSETGVLFPVEQIAGICRARGVLYHCDAVQAAGKVPIDVGKVPVDYAMKSRTGTPNARTCASPTSKVIGDRGTYRAQANRDK
jgi:hypothetical protein